MAITINTNVPSLVAQNKLNKNNSALQKTMNQLSTGARINNAADDAAGLAIAEKLKFQISGSNKAIDNISDGKNFINTAEGAMITVADHLQRINELLVQGASDLNDTEGRRAIMVEIDQRLKDIDVIANSANFNGQKLIDGGLEKMIIQIGGSYEYNTNTINIQPALTDCNLTALGKNPVGDGTDATKLGLKLHECLDPNSAKFGDEESIKAYLGGYDYLQVYDEDGNPTGDLIDENGKKVTPAFGDAFRKYMEDVQYSINRISSSRGLLGAYTNRMEATSSNLANTVENLETAKSRLTDVDIAKASSDMIKYQILQQTSSAVLAQANQLPSLAIQLIG